MFSPIFSAPNGQCDYALFYKGSPLTGTSIIEICTRTSGQSCCQEMIEKCIPRAIDFAKKATKESAVLSMSIICEKLRDINDAISVKVFGGSEECYGGELVFEMKVSNKRICCSGGAMIRNCTWVTTS